MGLMADFGSKLKGHSLLILLILLFFYFSFYTVKGDRGLLKYMYLKKEINQAQSIKDKYDSKKKKMEDNVKLLSSSSLDLDLLEERARVVLNLVGNDEFVILDEE